VVSDAEKSHGDAAGVGWEGERERTADDASKSIVDVETGGWCPPGMRQRGACLLLCWCPVF